MGSTRRARAECVRGCYVGNKGISARDMTAMACLKQLPAEVEARAGPRATFSRLMLGVLRGGGDPAGAHVVA